jgi:pyruvate dehydrogenase E1 component alpha subunit
MTAGEGATARALSLDIAGLQVDGNDVLAVHAAAAKLVQAVRAGSGPRLLHAVTYRVKGHVSVDPAAYRDPQELHRALQTDPISRARAQFAALAGTDASQLDAIEQAATAEVARAVQIADGADWPEAATAFTDVQTTGAGQWR